MDFLRLIELYTNDTTSETNIMYSELFEYIAGDSAYNTIEHLTISAEQISIFASLTNEENETYIVRGYDGAEVYVSGRSEMAYEIIEKFDEAVRVAEYINFEIGVSATNQESVNFHCDITSAVTNAMSRIVQGSENVSVINGTDKDGKSYAFVVTLSSDGNRVNVYNYIGELESVNFSYNEMSTSRVIKYINSSL